jgi:hypothetical protein
MKKNIAVGFAILVLGLLFSAQLLAQDKPAPKEMSVSGEVVDVACYLMGDAKGPDHAKCAAACAKNGSALGILTADGKLYVSLLPDDHKNNPNHLLLEHVGHTVEAKGLVRVKGGVQGMMIKSVAMAKVEEKK